MKKLFLLLVAVFFVMQATYAGATSMVTFNGADILAHATSLNPDTTPTIGDGRIDFSDQTQSIGTYSRPSTNISLDAFNNWVDGLGYGEGISQFNLWLQDGNSDQAAMWGETIALTDAYTDDINPFASTGWTASVYTIGDEWGDKWEGRKLITYTANSVEYYLRNGSTVTFGFTADIMGNDGATGPSYQMWVGAGGENSSDTGINQIVSDDNADYFQRAITAYATPVPEPTTMLLLGSGILSLVGFKRKLKKA